MLFRSVSSPSDLVAIRKSLESAGFEYESADVLFQPSLTVPIDVDHAKAVVELIDAIEDLDDVQNVFANFDMSEEVLASLS